MTRPGGRVGNVAIALVLAGCELVGGPQPDGPVGPQLVLDVENRSAQERVVEYKYEAAASAGGGEAAFPACSRSTIGFGDIGGAYEIRIDGQLVVRGEVPRGTPADGFFVVPLTVDSDGVPSTLGPPGWTRIPPEPNDVRLDDCG